MNIYMLFNMSLIDGLFCIFHTFDINLTLLNIQLTLMNG